MGIAVFSTMVVVALGMMLRRRHVLLPVVLLGILTYAIEGHSSSP